MECLVYVVSGYQVCNVHKDNGVKKDESMQVLTAGVERECSGEVQSLWMSTV